MSRLQHRGQRGQTAVEYLGLLLVVSVIIAAIVGSGLGGQISRGLERQVCQLSGQEDCGQASGERASRPPGPPDADRDGLSDKLETKLGTKVNVADSDGDRIPDGQEVNRYKTDPVLADTDADGLSDAQEIRSQGALDPLQADEDADGLGDAQELAIGTNPRRRDSDLEGGGIGDGLSDLEELRLGTDPTRPDSDGDGTRDGDEQEQGSDPLKDERSTLRKLVEGGSGFVLDHPFDFAIPTGAIRSGTAKGLSKAIEKAAPKLAGIRAAKDLKTLATLRRARAKAAEKLSKTAQRAKTDIKRANANERGSRASGAAEAGGDAGFHYTRKQVANLIEKDGLRPGSYLTKSGDLSPLQAQIDLALPPNRGLPGALIRVDLAGLRGAGYDVGEFTKVGRRYNMPGGGTELRFGRAIPRQFVKVIRP